MTTFIIIIIGCIVGYVIGNNTTITSKSKAIFIIIFIAIVTWLLVGLIMAQIAMNNSPSYTSPYPDLEITFTDRLPFALGSSLRYCLFGFIGLGVFLFQGQKRKGGKNIVDKPVSDVKKDSSAQ